jgi:hypothetical protein
LCERYGIVVAVWVVVELGSGEIWWGLDGTFKARCGVFGSGSYRCRAVIRLKIRPMDFVQTLHMLAFLEHLQLLAKVIYPTVSSKLL